MTPTRLRFSVSVWKRSATIAVMRLAVIDLLGLEATAALRALDDAAHSAASFERGSLRSALSSQSTIFWYVLMLKPIAVFSTRPRNLVSLTAARPIAEKLVSAASAYALARSIKLLRISAAVISVRFFMNPIVGIFPELSREDSRWT